MIARWVSDFLSKHNGRQNHISRLDLMGNVQVLLRMTAGFSFPFLCWRISPLYQQHLRKYNGITHTVLARWRGGDGPGRITSHQMHSVLEKGKSYQVLSNSEVSHMHELFYITAFIRGSNCIIMIMSTSFTLFYVKRLLMTCPAPIIHPWGLYDGLLLICDDSGRCLWS